MKFIHVTFLSMNLFSLSINGMQTKPVKSRHAMVVTKKATPFISQEQQNFEENLVIFRLCVAPYCYKHKTTDDNNQTYSISAKKSDRFKNRK